MSFEGQIKSANRTRTVAASTQECFDIVADIASYPDWVSGISSVEILKTDEQGRVLQAKFVAQSFGRTTTYVLAYDLSLIHISEPTRPY